MAESIDQLTAGMAAGHAAAVAAFYRRYFARLYALARRATRGRRDEAFCLDVVQEAVLRVIRSVRPVATEPQFEAWLRLVVQTAAYDRLRADRRRADRELVVAGGRAESHGGAAADPAGDAEQLVWLRRQIAQLDPTLARLIELRYDRHWTLARIGRLLGLSVGTVDGRLRRAIGTLRRRAREDFDDA